MRFYIIFVFLVGLVSACEKKEPFSADDYPEAEQCFYQSDLVSFFEPKEGWKRVRIGQEIRRATLLEPARGLSFGLKCGLKDVRLKFSYGISGESFGDFPSLELYRRTEDEEKLLWKDELKASGWREAELELSLEEGEVGDCEFYLRSSAPLFVGCPRVVSGGLTKNSLIFILVDALRRDALSCYGYNKNTSPNIDELARKGARFDFSISVSSFTVSSLASIFTGLYPFEHRAIFFTNLILSEELDTLSELLSRNGYLTASISGTYFHMSDFHLDQGFDYFDESCASKFFRDSAECIGLKAREWVEDHKDEKFFLFLHFVDPHAPYYPPKKFRDLFADSSGVKDKRILLGEVDRFSKKRRWYQIPRSPSKEELDYLRGLYDAEVSYVDEEIGRLFQKLYDLGLDSKLYIIFTSDHGEAFYEHKRVEHSEELHLEVLRTPLIISGPGIPEGKVISGLTESIDLYPTVAELLGISQSEKISGESLVPLLKYEKRGKDFALSICYLSEKRYWLSIIRFPYHFLAVFPEGKDFELYNIQEDPWEKNNIFESHKEVAEGLMEIVRSEEFLVEVGVKAKRGEKRESLEKLKELGYVK